MKSRRNQTPVLIAAMTATSLVAACDSSYTFEPYPSDAVAASTTASWAHSPGKPFHTVSALTRNLYVGTDLDAFIAQLASGDPGLMVAALLDAVQTLENTAMVQRMHALADEIIELRPNVVGLQEVTLLDLNVPPLGLDLEIDNLAVLLARLNQAGLNYVVASSVQNMDIALVPLPGSLITFRDRDVILVDLQTASVHPGSAASGTYAANVGEVAPGIALVRGWTSVDVTINGEQITVVNTHLESGNSVPELALLRAAQAQELAAIFAGAPRVILMGDLNDVEGSPMYQLLMGAGYLDTWRELRGQSGGYTCCHLPDLSNAAAAREFHSRIDYVLVRGLAPSAKDLKGSVKLVGDNGGDRFHGPAYRIWPSDHAGVFALLRKLSHKN